MFEKIVYIIAIVCVGVMGTLFTISIILHPECFYKEINPTYVYEDFDGNIGQSNYCYQNHNICEIGGKNTSVKWTYKVIFEYNE